MTVITRIDREQSYPGKATVIPHKDKKRGARMGIEQSHPSEATVSPHEDKEIVARVGREQPHPDEATVSPDEDEDKERGARIGREQSHPSEATVIPHEDTERGARMGRESPPGEATVIPHEDEERGVRIGIKRSHPGCLVSTPKLLHFNHPQFFNFDTTSATEGERTFDGCLLPDSMTLSSTLSDCTSEGRKFTDEANDFSLEIPEGAIPEGERHTVDVGVGLFGTFQFPEGLRPVSPVFWVCVRDQKNFQFSKHVPVTIPHFLNLENEDDIQSLGLTFLKADHNKNSEGLYEFNPTDGEMDFQTFKSHGILRTLHFCSLCIATRDKPKSLERALFCITAVLPKSSTPVGKSINLYFLITFLNLKTCLKKVDDIIATMELDGHKTKQVKFQFNTNTRTPALEMVITQPKGGKIGISGNTKVFRSEVDFFVKRRLSEGELNTLMSDKFYPPRFEGYFACFRANATLDDGKIVFKGATSDIVYDIHLDCPTAIPAKEAVDMSTPTESQPEPLDISRDLHIAKRHLQHLSKQEMKELFLELGLFDATVRDNFTDSSRDTYAEDLIRAWILGKDGIMIKEEYKGGATWENLKKALRNINHPGVAAAI
jgi:hypothetical protein